MGVYFISVIWQLKYMGYGYLLLEAMPFRVFLLLKDKVQLGFFVFRGAPPVALTFIALMNISFAAPLIV